MPLRGIFDPTPGGLERRPSGRPCGGRFPSIKGEPPTGAKTEFQRDSVTFQRVHSSSIIAQSKLDLDQTLQLTRVASTASAEAGGVLHRLKSTMDSAQWLREQIAIFVSELFSGLTGAELERKIRQAFDEFDAGGAW